MVSIRASFTSVQISFSEGETYGDIDLLGVTLIDIYLNYNK